MGGWRDLRRTCACVASSAAEPHFGEPNVAGDDRAFNIPIAISSVLPQGTAIVSNWQAMLWLREDARVIFAEAGGLGPGGIEIFSRHQVVFRGEERAAFCVTPPAAFCSISGL